MQKKKKKKRFFFQTVFFDIRDYFEVLVFEISRLDCITTFICRLSMIMG